MNGPVDRPFLELADERARADAAEAKAAAFVAQAQRIAGAHARDNDIHGEAAALYEAIAAAFTDTDDSSREVAMPVDLPQFMGEPTTCEGADRLRLSGQLHRVFDLMRDGQPRTLRSISELVGCSEASASARLRDFRQVRIMGGSGVCVVTRERLGPGVYAYRVRVPP